MNKNIKRMFFVTTLILLLVGLSAISAADVSNDTSSNSQQNVVKEVNVEKVSDNTMTDTSTKNIKKEEQTTDLYVSDSSGSDDNSGTNTSPYKTIQKALDTTNADSTFNIHIAEGTYKGLGNTNLTINGNHNINIIGEGNAIIDGEVNYTYHVTESGDFYWDSSKIWEPYENGTGNWAMNITTGNGLITLTNITIQNCWNPGGSSISSYNTSTIDNYANLEIKNVSFISNHGGTGGAIRNNGNATITIRDSLFDNNGKSSSTGNFGAGIYNNGTATIINSTFKNNYARWGTITNDKTIQIINCTLENNHAYDGTSTYKFGSGISSDTSEADMYNSYSLENIQTEIINTTFINNQQSDVYQGANGNLIINQSSFNTSTGVIIKSNDKYNNTIINSIFDNMIPTNIYTIMAGDNLIIHAIYAKNTKNLVIHNNTISVPSQSSVDAYAMKIDTYSEIYDNIIQGMIEIGSSNNIYNNSITSDSDFSISVTGNNNNITFNYLISKNFFGDHAVSKTKSNTVENNTPESLTFIINNDNYSQYFDENGNNNINIKNNSKIYLETGITNKNFIFNNISVIIEGYSTNTTIYNSTYIFNKPSTLKNIKINNTNPLFNNTIMINTTNTLIQNVSIESSNTTCIHTIIVNKSDNRLINNTLRIYNDAEIMDNVPQTIGILINSSNNEIINGSILISTTTNNETELVAIALNGDNSIVCNNTIKDLTIQTFKGYYNHVILIKNSSNNSFYRIYVANLYSTYYANVYDITGNSSGNLIYDIMAINPDSEYYNKIVINGSNTFNNTIDFSDLAIDSYQPMPGSYIILENTTNNTLLNGNILLSQENISCIELINTNNTLIKNMSIKLGNKTQTGIKITNSNNNTIVNCTIIPVDLSKTQDSHPIRLQDSSNNIITHNYLIYDDDYQGDLSVLSDNQDNIIENNTPYNIILTDENYYNYFNEDHKFKHSTNNLKIVIGSDIHNKDISLENMTLNLLNQNKYTLNNCSISLNNVSITSVSDLILIQEKSDTTILNFNNSNIAKIENNLIIGYGTNITALSLINNKKTLIQIQNNNITIKSNQTIKTNIIKFKDNPQTQFTKNTILINTTTENNPIIYVNSLTRRTTISSNYIESLDICGNEAISGNDTTKLNINNNMPTTTGYKSILNVEIDSILLNTETNISIRVTDAFGNNITGLITATINEKEITVENNTIKYKAENTEDITVIITYSDPTGKYNTTSTTKTLTVTPTTLTVDPITATAGDIINITARITAGNDTLIDINKGKVTFKVNGKTLKDANGKVIYAKVVNGVAMIENYEVPADWTKEGTTIQAVYSGSTQCDKLTSEKTNITVTKAVPTLTINDITATAGETITLTATITDGNNVINTGKVVFKINGKTVKDTNGKVIYAKVSNNQVNFTYTLPADMKAKEYNLTATFISSDYDRLEDTKTLTVN